MNKKNKLLVLLLLMFALLSMGASTGRLTRLTVINKSGRDIEMSLSGRELDQVYYLRVSEGSRQSPTEKVFTVTPDVYTSILYYVELWDPVYGYQCASRTQRMDLNRNVRVVVLECDRKYINAGEPPSMLKYGGRAQKKGR